MRTEIKKCKYCQTEIPFKAKWCPNCGKDIRDWFNRHPIITILGLIIIVPIVISNIISNSGSSFGNNNSSSSKSLSSGSVNQTIDKTKASSEKSNEELLELISFRCYTEYSYFHITGEVKNISNKSLENVMAVGKAYTKDGEFVKSDDAIIDYNPILSGQTSPFEVLMTGNPEINKCDVEFKEFWGGTIPTKRK